MSDETTVYLRRSHKAAKGWHGCIWSGVAIDREAYPAGEAPPRAMPVIAAEPQSMNPTPPTGEVVCQQVLDRGGVGCTVQWYRVGAPYNQMLQAAKAASAAAEQLIQANIEDTEKA